MPAALADNDRKLTFVVDVRALPRIHDFAIRRQHSRWRLEKKKRLLWRFAAHFSGVFGIVTADGDDFCGSARSEQLHAIERPNSPRGGDFVAAHLAFIRLIVGDETYVPHAPAIAKVERWN